MKTSLFWAPGVLGILFALFLRIFSFDEFGQGLGFWQTTLSFELGQQSTTAYSVIAGKTANKKSFRAMNGFNVLILIFTDDNPR